MPFIRTNPLDTSEGHLRCEPCGATSPTFRMALGVIPEGWTVGHRKRPMQSTELLYYCPEHASPERT